MMEQREGLEEAASDGDGGGTTSLTRSALSFPYMTPVCFRTQGFHARKDGGGACGRGEGAGWGGGLCGRKSRCSAWAHVGVEIYYSWSFEAT